MGLGIDRYASSELCMCIVLESTSFSMLELCHGDSKTLGASCSPVQELVLWTSLGLYNSAAETDLQNIICKVRPSEMVHKLLRLLRHL